jgi:hypothetical protein
MKHRLLRVDYLACLKAIEPQKPVRLIKPVLTQKGRAGIQAWQK